MSEPKRYLFIGGCADGQMVPVDDLVNHPRIVEPKKNRTSVYRRCVQTLESGHTLTFFVVLGMSLAEAFDNMARSYASSGGWFRTIREVLYGKRPPRPRKVPPITPANIEHVLHKKNES